MAFANIELVPGPDIQRPTLSIMGGQEVDIILEIRDEDGHPVNLTPFVVTDPVPMTQYREPPIEHGIYLTVRSHTREVPPTIGKTIFVDGDPVMGNVRLPFKSGEFLKPGLYLAEVALISEGSLKHAYPLYVEVSPSLTWRQETAGPLTIAEVRLWLRDNSPEDNFLLDEVEFKDTEIMAAIRRGVDMWNSEPPMMARHTYNATNFPFRSAWIDITIAFLKQIAYHWYLRNHLPYAAGGLQVDDKGKWQVYMAEAEEGKQHYLRWLKDTKRQLNANQAFGRVGYVRLP